MKFTLYHMGHCPYCKRTIKVIKDYKLTVTYKDLDVHEKFRKELITGGGKQQVPCLLMTEKSKSDQLLYESQDIINFIKKNY